MSPTEESVLTNSELNKSYENNVVRTVLIFIHKIVNSS